MTALLGTGFFAKVTAGAIAGALSDQYARLPVLVLTGQNGQAGNLHVKLQDLVFDAVLGGIGGAF